MNITHFIKSSLAAMLLLTLSSCSTEVPAISTTQAATLFENNEAVMIDVREPDERNAQYIEGSIFIPLAQLEKRVSELEAYKDRPVITQCRSGRRSAIAGKILLKAGFTQVHNLTGGIIAWQEDGFKTVSAP